MLSVTRTLTLATVLAGVTVSSAVQAQQAPSSTCGALANMRSNYQQLHTAMASKRVEMAIEEKEPFDAEETGCISDYGANLGLGVPGLTSAFLDGLKDKACSAMDSYIKSNLNALTASISGPMDLVGLDLGIGESDSPFNVGVNQRDIGLDVDQVLDDVMSGAPKIENGNFNYNGSGDSGLGDYYLNQSRGREIPAPNWNPQGGGRTQ